MYNRCTLVEFRGVWIASVYNIDWPKTLDNPEAQKQEFIEILDKLQFIKHKCYICPSKANFRCIIQIIYKSMV